MKLSKYMLAGVLAVLASGAFAQDAQLRDLSVEQSSVAQTAAPRASSLTISVSADRSDATYAIGETVRLFLNVNEDAYVTVLDVGPTGQVTQLFPNRFQTDGKVQAGRPVEIAGGASGARITAAGAAGTELIKVIASSKPLTVVAEQQLQNRGIFYGIDGGVQTLARDLQVVANQAAQPETKIAFANFALYTTAARAAAAQTLVVVPGQAAPAANAPTVVVVPVQPAPTAATLLPVVTYSGQAPALVSIPAQQPFPLLLAADKPAYRIGEKVTLAVTTLQACNLTVLEIATSGQVRTLFPNANTPVGAIGALQTVLIAGGPSPTALPVSGPAGTEQIVAVCTTDAAPLAMQGADRSAFARDLTVVAARPAGTTAIASTAFAVQN